MRVSTVSEDRWPMGNRLQGAIILHSGGPTRVRPARPQRCGEGGQAMRRDIDEALQGWPHEPEPGEVLAREIRARDGRTLLQIRIELGLLQLEVTGRPDGVRPHGFPSYLDFLRDRAGIKPGKKKSAAESWKMTPEHCAEADREFFQFYHRRVAWLSLRNYDKAVRDADHTLSLMDFVAQHGADPEYIANHEKYRGLVLFHRTQAASMAALERRKPEEAIDQVREGIERLASHRKAWVADRDEEEIPNETLIEQLNRLETDIRRNFAVEKTLREQLDEAVASEDYERAARLRDLIKSQPRS